MSKGEKTFCLFYALYFAVYVPCFIIFIPEHFEIIQYFHLLGMFLSLVLLVIVFGDIYRRDFPNPNTKVTWTLLICMLGLPVFIYIFKHALKPRHPSPGIPFVRKLFVLW